MTRIVAGRAGGRRLATPKGDATRPTSDRVREALFSTLESLHGPLEGLRFLDLYAGSGAVGLEAWSRGAEVVLVESDRRTAALVAANARTIGAPAHAAVAAAVGPFLAHGPGPGPGPATGPTHRPGGERGGGGSFDIVFADPPYPLADATVASDLAALVAQGWLASGATVVVERSSRSPEPAWPDGLSAGARKKYGETTLWYGHAP